ncbi:hypothetical protein [Duganella vulcania]|uniref:Uncharacterized protein n=1 Tax=Duganella vulcania TaxID=2692166 RepID=A0A845GHI7_9BURK|nr:hypothetical protein [Duganella vulcania]MYM92766.1 hypothetical protein [Duganella vulcania]
MHKVAKVTGIALAAITLTAGVVWYEAMREIRKESKLAQMLELPYRTASWTLTEPGMRPYRVPDELQTLQQNLPEAKFHEINARIGLRELNIVALRKAAAETENTATGELFPTAYSGVKRFALIADDGSDTSTFNIRSLARTLPTSMDIVVVQSVAAADSQKTHVHRFPRTILAVVADEMQRDGEAPYEAAANLADAIYDLPITATRTLAYTLFLRHAVDLTWPDTAYIDKAAARINAKAMHVPITAASTDLLLGIGDQKDLFVSQKAIADEAAKREQLSLPVTNRTSFLTSYRQIFGAVNVWELPLGPDFSNLNAMVKIVGEKSAVIIDGKGIDAALPKDDVIAIEKCTDILMRAGYKVTKIPASLADIISYRSPLSGILLPPAVREKGTLLVPVKPSESNINPATANALLAAGITPIPIQYDARKGTTLGQSVALLR